MKIKRINTAFLLLALAGMTLTGCSNEDLANITPQEEGTGNVSFSIVEKDYEPADNTPKSRAAIEETKPEIQDLGDGLMAEVSLVPDTTQRVEAPKTRAINTPTRYTIQAFQGGVKKGELKGTFNGSTFTPDAGQPKSISLPHGTYDFVCFNDGVTSNGTQLTVNRADAGTARFDVRRNIQINQDPKQQVTFTMKHAGALVESYVIFVNTVIAYKAAATPTVNEKGESVYKLNFVNPGERLKYKFESAVNSIPETMVYGVTTNTFSYPTMGQISKSGELKEEESDDPLTYPGMPATTSSLLIANDYLLPSTDCSKLKITFTFGDFYGSSLAGKTITVSTHKLVEANKRYFIQARLYITNQYLYSDGTSGPRNKNLTKIPVAVVINPYAHIAMALHDVNEGGSDQIQWNTTTSQEADASVKGYREFFAGSIGSIPDRKPLGTAEQAARNYTPLMTHTWNVPTFSDFIGSGTSLGRMLENNGAYINNLYQYLFPTGAAATGFTPAPSTINFPVLDMTRFNAAFTNVNGEAPSGTYWTGTECKVGSEYKMATIEISGGKFHLGLKSKTETAKVRPVIYY